MERMAREHVRAKERARRNKEAGIKEVDDEEALMRHLTELIYRKIVERTRSPQDQFREAYRIFGAPDGDITQELFNSRMKHMGLIITDSDLTKLFNRFDANGSGNIDFHEIMEHVMPKDYGFDRFNVYNAERREAEYIRAALPYVKNPKLEKFPEMSDQEVDLDHLTEMIHTKIVERTARSQDQYREAYRLFRVPNGKINEPEFKRRMRLLGLVITDHDLHRLFSRMDDNGNGTIEFSELIKYVMPKDLGYDPFKVHRAKHHEVQYVKKAMKESAAMPPATSAKMPSYLDDAKVTVDDYEQLIQRKMMQRVKRSSDQFREAYRVVGARGGKCDMAEFELQLKRLGVYIPKKDLPSVFSHLAHGEKAIDVQVMLRRLLPEDFVRAPDAAMDDKPPDVPRRPGYTPPGRADGEIERPPSRSNWSIPADDGLHDRLDGSGGMAETFRGPDDDGHGGAGAVSAEERAAKTRAALAAAEAGMRSSPAASRPATAGGLVKQMRAEEQARALSGGVSYGSRPASRGSMRSARSAPRESPAVPEGGRPATPKIPEHIARMTDKKAAMRAMQELSRSASRRSRKSRSRPVSRGGPRVSGGLGGGSGGGVSVVDLQAPDKVRPRSAGAGSLGSSPSRPTSAPAMRRRNKGHGGAPLRRDVPVQSMAMAMASRKPGEFQRPPRPGWLQDKALSSTVMLTETLRHRSGAAMNRMHKHMAVGNLPVTWGAR